MKWKTAAVLVAAAALLALAGCSASGTLQVTNGTNDNLVVTISGQDRTVSSGDSTTESWDLNYFPVEEDKTVSYSVEGLYKFQDDLSARVTSQHTTTVTVQADAGAISIENTSYTDSIVEAHVSVSTDLTWGSNDLSASIGPRQTSYIRVTPNVGSANYDVKLVDNYGYTWEIGVNPAHVHPSIAADRLWQIHWDGYTATWGTSLASVAQGRAVSPEELGSTTRQSASQSDTK